MMHTLLCKQGDRWVILRRDHETVAWYLLHKGAIGRLRETVEASLDLDPLTHTWTFSEREADVVMANLAEDPSEIPHVDRLLNIEAYTREGRFDDDSDRLATLHRSPGEVWVWTSGLAEVFRPKDLRKQILNYFGFDSDDRHAEQRWKSFIPGKHGVDRPWNLRELWVRLTWRARELCADAFPAFKPGPVITVEQQAKRLAKLPMHKSAVRRAKHQDNLQRFRAESEARAALREQGTEGEVAR
jgi:hypothetical protein